MNTPTSSWLSDAHGQLDRYRSRVDPKAMVLCRRLLDLCEIDEMPTLTTYVRADHTLFLIWRHKDRRLLLKFTSGDRDYACCLVSEKRGQKNGCVNEHHVDRFRCLIDWLKTGKKGLK